MGHGLGHGMTDKLGRLWARRPLFVLAAGLVVVAAVENNVPDFTGVTAFALSGLVCLSGGWRAGFVTGFLTIFLIASVRWHDGVQSADEKRFADLGVKTVQARLIEDATGGGGRWSGIARLRDDEFQGKKVNWIGSGQPPPSGTELRATGEFGALEPGRNPGTMDRRKRLRDLGVVANFKASEMRSSQWTGPVSAKAAAFKTNFREAIVAGLDEDGIEAKTIRAVVIGERARDSLELVESFRNSGTLHVFTVSGLHVAMLGSIVWFLFKRANVPRRWAIPAIVVAMFGYVWLTGNGPAAIRAAWMGTVLLAAFALRRRADLLNTLGAVLLVAVLLDPRLIRMPGVQLSYGVVASIGLLTIVTRKSFEWIAMEENFLPVSETGWLQRKWLLLRRRIADGFAVSTAASLGSAPLTALHFGLFTPISVLATIALVPLVYVLLSAALLSAIVYPISKTTAGVLNRQNAVVARVCVKTAAAFASLPGASTATRIHKSDTLIIYDLDYGSSAACFAPAGGNGVLIDTGGDYSMRTEVGPSLRRLGIDPDSVIFTHADGRHSADPEMLGEMFSISQIGIEEKSAPHYATATWSGSANTNVAKFSQGNRFSLGGNTDCEVLYATRHGQYGALADDLCIVFMMRWNNWKILWTGDAGRLTESELLGSDIDLKADVIVAGLHESDFSLTPMFVKAVSPRIVITGRPAGSDMDSPRQAWLEKIKKQGVRVLSQTETGGITVTALSDGSLSFRGHVDASETFLKR